jgi:hypothetical protein
MVGVLRTAWKKESGLRAGTSWEEAKSSIVGFVQN